MDDDQFEEMYRRNPLKAFSIYTVTQLQSLRRMALEIQAALDQKDSGPDIMKAYDFFWFWTMGAYEIIRTMTQHKQCFSSKIASDAAALKEQLAKVRMPFAKQEKSARRGPIDGPYNSLVSVGDKSLIFEIEGATIGSRELMNEVEAFFACIQPADVLAKFPEGQRP
ncbi:MAG: hypothetical protein E5W98_26835 [Mesorhizobium sp.]|nr:MAG: hypothetical protein E5W98_26835 [Mesorhizobium sp.]